ncbi:MAG: hypothetical protein PHQ19_07980 [Candidatus Krumholzibacteria bacterium]|nr:hypothetical protein [Candidatus Krumholzibacteria bacterium]
MGRKRSISCATACAASLLWLSAGCSNDVFTGERRSNAAPEIWLSSGPVEGDTTGYQVHFYWGGWDPDGEISFFEFAIVDGDPFGFDPVDTTGIDAWTRTSAYDSVFRVSASENPRPYEPNELYTRYDQTHTLFMRGVDEEGVRSDVATRSFTAWTLAPFAQITHPEGSNRSYSNVITFRWEGRDPIDSPTNFQLPDSIRHLCIKILTPEGIYNPNFPIIDDLNANPWRYEQHWSPWIHYLAPGDSGRMTIVGDDEIIELNFSYIFALQAMDEAGAVTAIFRGDQNVRRFGVSEKAGPLLTITEPFLGGFQFLGRFLNAARVELPPGVPLNFCWSADASSYGGEIRSYRYGWDIQQLDDPAQWDVSASPFHRCAPGRTWYSGIHTFYIEAVDNGGRITLGRIQIEIIPFSMERTLLWVDDWSLGAPLANKMLPGETQHDEFWTGICSRAGGFFADRDVYDCAANNNRFPDMRTVGKYRNIIWTYGNSQNGVLRQVIRFTPETSIGTGTQLVVNYLSLFLAKGGHLWTSGRSDQAAGGLSVIFPVPPEFPASFKFDMTRNEEDTSGVNCMGHRDYCITLLDKIIGTFRTGAEMPPRSLNMDGMRYAYSDVDDAVTSSYPGLPSRLPLWSEVVAPGMYFNPQTSSGFIYVEIYNPAYWMTTSRVDPQGCFHPMYRMRARSTRSPIDRQTVAVWVDRYSHIVAENVPGAVAARSVHFGLPLWFFERSTVDSIATVIFDEWQILGE